ncbi:MAG: hypothetical protein J3K34DRAFT_399332 [Monoraphidium minutum]|nr:MAG: hypothetical protein J3K34DRAFT_399332 [Monoraphidium minutum]
MKLRVSRSRFHGTPSFVCPGAFGGGEGSTIPLTRPYGPPAAAGGAAAGKSAAAPRTVAVLIDDLTKVLSVDSSTYQITVEAGLRIDQLLKWAEANGMALDRGAISSYAELSIAGVLTTGGHGTGHNVSCNMADATINITWVDVEGTVHTSARHSPEGHALSGGVGMMGIITEVGVQMTPPTLTKAISKTFLKDTNLPADIDGYLKNTPYVAIVWRPDLKKYSAFQMFATDKLDLGSTWALVPPVPSAFISLIELFYLPWQGDYNDMLLSKILNPLNCLTQAATIFLQTWAGLGLIPQPISAGSTNKVMGGGCLPTCPWEQGLAVDDVAFMVDRSQLPALIDDIKKIVTIDLQESGRALDRCISSGHFLIRFGKDSQDYAGPMGGLKEPVSIELAILRSKALPGVHAKFSFVQEVFEQLTLCKYKGRPHWGKNFDRTFTSPDCPVRDNVWQMDKMLAIASKYDPEGVMTPPLMSKVIDRTPYSHSPRCALSKQCYCLDDSHCGEGHACVPSAAFPEFRVCRAADLKAMLG